MLLASFRNLPFLSFPFFITFLECVFLISAETGRTLF
nr:MAG TPA: hypothetical protein [Caudoviricetes sp.]